MDKRVDRLQSISRLGYSSTDILPAVMSSMDYSTEKPLVTRRRSLVSSSGSIVDVEFNANNVPKHVWVDADLWAQMEAKLQADTLQERYKVARSVLFTYRPFPGWTRVDNWIQLRPVAVTLEDATGHSLLPGRPQAGYPNPFLIEVKYRDTNLMFLEGERRIRAVQEAGWLLAGFLDIAVFQLRVPYAWTLSQGRYSLMVTGMGTGLDGISDEFSDVGDIAPIALTDTETYFRELGVSTDVFRVPDLSGLYSRYQELTPKDRMRFLRVCASLMDASDPNASESQRVVGLVSALEPLAGAPVQCPSCGGKVGITKAFGELLAQYVMPTPEVRHWYMKLYALRSSIVHGSWRYDVDESFWNPSETKSIMPLVAWSSAKQGAINWLFAQTQGM